MHSHSRSLAHTRIVTPAIAAHVPHAPSNFFLLPILSHPILILSPHLFSLLASLALFRPLLSHRDHAPLRTLPLVGQSVGGASSPPFPKHPRPHLARPIISCPCKATVNQLSVCWFLFFLFFLTSPHSR